MSHRRGNLLTSFNYAFDGIVHALRYERNMWIHFGIAALVLIAGLFFALTRLEVIALLVAISFVLITEMFNTAIEHVVDLVTDEDDPRARIAKDVAAGAVLVAAVNAVAVAYLVFYDKITSVPYTILSKLRGSPIDVTVIALFIVILAAIALKALTHRGTAFHGGLPSVHAALAFAAWVAVTFVAAGTTFALPISAITLFLAVLVAQSRVQAKIHTLARGGRRRGARHRHHRAPLPHLVPAVSRAAGARRAAPLPGGADRRRRRLRAVLGVRRGRRGRRPVGPQPPRRQRRERRPTRRACARSGPRSPRSSRTASASCAASPSPRWTARTACPAGSACRRSPSSATRRSSPAPAARCASCACASCSRRRSRCPEAGADG